MEMQNKLAILFYKVLKNIYCRIPINPHRREALRNKLLNLKWIRHCYVFNSNHHYPGLEYTHQTTDYLDAIKLDIFAIAFYIPRLSKWSHAFQAAPQFLGHYQPHLPAEEGIESSCLLSVIKRQVFLAKQYGIYGFCFYYNMLNGAKNQEKTLNQFLTHSSLTINFCLCLSDEKGIFHSDNLTVQTGQTTDLSTEDILSLINRLSPIFSDQRYIRVDDKPLLIVSHSILLPNCYEIIQRWRQCAKEIGFVDLYLVVLSGKLYDPRPFGFDAVIERPGRQNTSRLENISDSLIAVKKDYQGKVYSYTELAEKYSQTIPDNFVSFREIIPGWDNSPGKDENKNILHNSSPIHYAIWLRKLCAMTFPQRPQERFLFINAWNLWDCGAHLEPDKRFGYGYLQLTANVLSDYYKDQEITLFIEKNNNKFRKINSVAIILHCYYDDIIISLLKNYLVDNRHDIDLFLTVKHNIKVDILKQIQQLFPNTYFIAHKNRGRDISPFLVALRTIVELGYEFSCKLHTKKSVHRLDGEILRKYLFDTLLSGPNKVQQVMQLFIDNPQLGILAPQRQILNLEEKRFHAPNVVWLDKLLKLAGRSDLIGSYSTFFPAGSMYWFRVHALVDLDTLVPQGECFEDELGQFDGTLAHGLERIIALFAAQRGYQMKAIDN